MHFAKMRQGPYGTLLFVSMNVFHFVGLSHKQLSSVIHYVASCRLKHCLSVSNVFLSLFLNILPFCANAFDFGALETNPAGRIVPYKPVYKAVYFDNVDSKHQSQTSQMNKKTNKHNTYALEWDPPTSTLPPDDSSSLPPFLSESTSAKVSSNRNRARDNSNLRQNARNPINRLVTPIGASVDSMSTYSNHPDQSSNKKRKNDKRKQTNKGKSITPSVANLSPFSPRPSQLISDTPATIEKLHYSGYKFASTPFNYNFSLGTNVNIAQSSPVPYDSVYFGFDSDDMSGSSKQNDPSVDDNLDNYDLLDYISEEVLDSSERGALANKNVNPNKFVPVDYASNEQASLIQSLYTPHTNSIQNLYRDTASVSKHSPRQPRYVFHTNTLNITWPVKKVSEVAGNITLGGLMMVHEREDKKVRVELYSSLLLVPFS